MKLSLLLVTMLVAAAPSTRAADAPSAPAPPRAVAWDEAPVQATRLQALRGGSSQAGTINADGTVSSTVATNVVTGANSVSGGSFANASGLPTVIQNSGANVLIQNSTVINVQFKP